MDTTYDDDYPIDIVTLKEFFTILPNDFLQKTNMSLEAKGMASYLASQSSEFVPRPTRLKKLFNIGDYTWRKISKELRDLGWLREVITSGGTRLKFTVQWRNKPGAQQNQPTVDYQRSAKADAPQEKADRRLSTPLISINSDSESEYDMKERTHERERESKSSFFYNKPEPELTEVTPALSVDDEVLAELKGLGVSPKVFNAWINNYGTAKVGEKIKMLSTTKNVQDKEAWLQSALTNDYKPTESRQSGVKGGAAYLLFTEENYAARTIADIARSDPNDWREQMFRERAAANGQQLM